MQEKKFWLRRKTDFIYFFKFLFLGLLITLVFGCSLGRERKSGSEISKVVRTPKPPPENMLLQESLKVVEKWYEFSDKNDREGLKALLSSHWKEKENRARLSELLRDWTFTENELERGYRGVTRRKEIISQRVVRSSYGEIAILELKVSFEVWDEKGHRFLEGINTFGLIWDYERDKWQPRIRTIEWREIKK